MPDADPKLDLGRPEGAADVCIGVLETFGDGPAVVGAFVRQLRAHVSGDGGGNVDHPAERRFASYGAGLVQGFDEGGRERALAMVDEIERLLSGPGRAWADLCQALSDVHHGSEPATRVGELMLALGDEGAFEDAAAGWSRVAPATLH